MFPDVVCDTGARHTPYSRTNFLDSSHEGIGEKHRPKHAQAELCADLGICCDSARVIIGCTGDKPRSKYLKKAFFTGEFLPLGRRGTFW